MTRSIVDGSQNVEVSVKLPSQKPVGEQLEIMEEYTRVHRESSSLSRERRELNCLKVIYPRLFRSIEEQDRLAGRLDFLPIGFGCVTSLGGVGHYCVFDKLRAMKDCFQSDEDKARIDALYEYWSRRDLKALYCEKVLTSDTTGRFIDCRFPFMATARLSGMMLHYDWLCQYGIDGLKEKAAGRLALAPDNEYLRVSLEALTLFQTVVDALFAMAFEAQASASPRRRTELELICASLSAIRSQPPKTFHQAIQLIWLYALLAGCINYGRLDDILGPYLVRDLESGRITREDAREYLKSLWNLIENRRTTVNGRIIVGGYGRRRPAEADEFARLAIEVTRECRYVEPQFTLRLTKDTPQDILDLALDSLGQGTTYPTLYNDEVNVPALMHAMRIDREAAEQYVPFGCGEFVIQGQSVGTPNTLLNLLKLLTIALNEGSDPFDGQYKAGPVPVPPADSFSTFEEFYGMYKKLLDYYFDLSADAQYDSYEAMNREVSFLFTSLLMDDCIERGKALLDGGVRYLGGTNETYGNINTSDALYAIKTLVFDRRAYRLSELAAAAAHNFVGYEPIRQALLDCDKYGNDIEEADALANDLFLYVANGIRDRGIQKGMQYYLIVISNNQTNTEWGRQTAASLDGRLSGTYMNPANNPQGGADKSGPTALLNSLRRFDARYHGGSVQNIKFTPRMFNQNREKIKALFRAYFKNGGCHLMVTVVDRGILEDAQKHPEKYPGLIVRVSGFSAVFVRLERDVQDELLSRVLYDD